MPTTVTESIQVNSASSSLACGAAAEDSALNKGPPASRAVVWCRKGHTD